MVFIKLTQLSKFQGVLYSISAIPIYTHFVIKILLKKIFNGTNLWELG